MRGKTRIPSARVSDAEAVTGLLIELDRDFGLPDDDRRFVKEEFG
jgi:hypothetical protein